MNLPPGQRAIGRFPRFGTHLDQPAPPVPADPAIEVRGAVRAPFTVPLGDLATLPRREISADFHCVAGWSATGLRWEGVPFADFFRLLVEPALLPGEVSHVVFHGLDGYWSYALLEDALADDVLVAQNLDGHPLDSDHGAPARLVSPSQYGFVSTKHLCAVEVRGSEPPGGTGSATAFARQALRLSGFRRHPRARVHLEERHSHLPGWAVRPLGRLFFGPTALLSRRGRARRSAG